MTCSSDAAQSTLRTLAAVAEVSYEFLVEQNRDYEFTPDLIAALKANINIVPLQITALTTSLTESFTSAGGSSSSSSSTRQARQEKVKKRKSSTPTKNLLNDLGTVTPSSTKAKQSKPSFFGEGEFTKKDGAPKQNQGRPVGSRMENGKLVITNSKKRPTEVSVKVSEKRIRNCCCDALQERLTEAEKLLAQKDQIITDLKRSRDSFASHVHIKEVQLQGEMKLRSSVASICTGQPIPTGTFTAVSPIKYPESSGN